jgi:hypothetical protein
MTGLAILVELHRLGVETIRVESGQIIVGPLSVVPAELRRAAAENKAELLRLLAEPDAAHIAQLDAEYHGRDRLAKTFLLNPGPIDALAAAKSLIRTCRECGVGLRLEADGTLVIESNGRAWRSLVRSIEAQVDAVAQLIEARWDSDDA